MIKSLIDKGAGRRKGKTSWEVGDLAHVSGQNPLRGQTVRISKLIALNGDEQAPPDGAMLQKPFSLASLPHPLGLRELSPLSEEQDNVIQNKTLGNLISEGIYKSGDFIMFRQTADSEPQIYELWVNPEYNGNLSDIRFLDPQSKKAEIDQNRFQDLLLLAFDNPMLIRIAPENQHTQELKKKKQAEVAFSVKSEIKKGSFVKGIKHSQGQRFEVVRDDGHKIDIVEILSGDFKGGLSKFRFKLIGDDEVKTYKQTPASRLYPSHSVAILRKGNIPCLIQAFRGSTVKAMPLPVDTAQAEEQEQAHAGQTDDRNEADMIEVEHAIDLRWPTQEEADRYKLAKHGSLQIANVDPNPNR